jgi:uncharacterized membrane protein
MDIILILVVIGVIYQFVAIDGLKARLTRLEKKLESPQVTPIAQQAPVSTAVQTAVPAISRQVMPPLRPAEPDIFDKFFARILTAIRRYFTEGNLIVRVGIIVLFCGLAFLLDYANDNGMLPIELRLAAAASAGMALLILGWRLRLGHSGYALSLQGGGIALMYLTVFTAFRMYGLLSGWVAFPLLLVLGVVSAVLSVRQNAAALAVLGISGGFLAPVLTSTGGGSHVVLFSYYALLNLGVLAIAWFRSWRALNLVGFVFTYLIGTVWGVLRYRSELYASTEPFLILFFLFYIVITILFALRQPPRLRGYVDGTLAFGNPLFAFAIQSYLVQDFEYGMAYSTGAVGMLYLLLAWRLFARGSQSLRLLAEAFLALAVVFLSLTIPFALDGEWITTAWALEGAALLWVGVRQQKRPAIAFGLLLQLFAGAGYLLEAGGRGDAIAVLNALCLSSALVSAAGLFSSYYLYRHFHGSGRWEAACATPFLIWGLLWWFGNGVHEIETYAPVRYGMTAIILLTALSCACLGLLERRYDWKTLRHTALGLLVALAMLVLHALINKPHFFADYGYLAWSIAAAVYYLLLQQRDRLSGVSAEILNPLHALGLWLIVGMLSYEAHWSVERWLQLAGSWDYIVIGLIPAAAIAAASYLPCWPFSAHRDAYVGLAGFTLAGFLMLWTLSVNLATAGDPWPLPYLPLLNALDIAQLLVFWTLVQWWRHPHVAQSWGDEEHIFYSVTAGLAFLWLNAVLIRSLHYWFDVPLDFDTIFHSTLVQACLSVFWTLIGLSVMLLATRRELRRVWIVAAGLLGVTVIKLFLLDLADTDTLESIISSIVVGILLLLVGYYSPLPPRVRD